MGHTRYPLLGSALAKTMKIFACCALVIHALVPFKIQTFPFFV